MAADLTLAGAYHVLGLDPGVSPLAAKRRYLDLVRRWHPDRHPAGSREAATRKTQEITEAFRVLRHAARHREVPLRRARPAETPPVQGARAYHFADTTLVDRIVAAVIGMAIGVLLTLAWGDSMRELILVPLLLGAVAAIWGARVVEFLIRIVWWIV